MYSCFESDSVIWFRSAYIAKNSPESWIASDVTAEPVTVPLGASKEGKVTVGIVAIKLQVPLTDTGAEIGAEVEADMGLAVGAELLETITDVAEGKIREEVSGTGVALGVKELGLVAEVKVLYMLVIVVGKNGKTLLLLVSANDECTLLTPVAANDDFKLLISVPSRDECTLLNPAPDNDICVLVTPVPGKGV